MASHLDVLNARRAFVTALDDVLDSLVNMAGDQKSRRVLAAASQTESEWLRLRHLADEAPADLVPDHILLGDREAMRRHQIGEWCEALDADQWREPFRQVTRWGEGARLAPARAPAPALPRPAARPVRRATVTPRRAPAPAGREPLPGPAGMPSGRLPDVPNPRAAAALVDVARRSGKRKDWKAALDCAQRTGDRDSEAMARMCLLAPVS